MSPIYSGTIYDIHKNPLYDVKKNEIFEYGTSRRVGYFRNGYIYINLVEHTFTGGEVKDKTGKTVYYYNFTNEAEKMDEAGQKVVLLVIMVMLAAIIALLFLPLYFSITDFTKIDFVNKLICKIRKKEYVEPGEKVWTDLGKKVRIAFLVASILPFITIILTFIIPAMATFGFQLALGIAAVCLVARFFLFKKKKDLLLVVTGSEND